jgi:hypothetical protein
VSAALYTVRVYHDGNRPGCIRIDGLHRHINMPPKIPGLPWLDAIDFAPATATYLLRVEFEGQREMTDREIAAVHAWLGLVAKGEA